MYIDCILFVANNTNNKIDLVTPIEGDNFDEIRAKAKRRVEEYMFENHIPGPYRLLLL